MRKSEPYSKVIHRQCLLTGTYSDAHNSLQAYANLLRYAAATGSPTPPPTWWWELTKCLNCHPVYTVRHIASEELFAVFQRRKQTSIQTLSSSIPSCTVYAC